MILNKLPQKLLLKILFTIIFGSQCVIGFASCADSNFLDKTKIDGSILKGQNIKNTDPVAKRTVLIAQNFNLNNHRPQFFGLCTGVVIDSNTILTAAHCAKNFKTSKVLFTTDIYTDTFTDSSTDSLSDKNIFNIKTAIIHENYLEPSPENVQVSKYDIALLKIDRTISGIDSISNYLTSYLMLSSTTEYIKKTDAVALLKPVIAGFGKTHLIQSVENKDPNTTPVNGILQKADIEIAETQYSLPLLMVDQRLKSGVCSGDSGGPLFVYRNGELYLQGLAIAVLFNNPFEQKYSLCYGQGIYLNLDFLKNWISENIKKLN